MNNVSNTHSSYKTYAHGVSFKKSEHELLHFFFGKIVFIFLNLLLHNVKMFKRFFFYIQTLREKQGYMFVDKLMRDVYQRWMIGAGGSSPVPRGQSLYSEV